VHPGGGLHDAALQFGFRIGFVTAQHPAGGGNEVAGGRVDKMKLLLHAQRRPPQVPARLPAASVMVTSIAGEWSALCFGA
jgi:hypothetical protein